MEKGRREIILFSGRAGGWGRCWEEVCEGGGGRGGVDSSGICF